MCWCWMRIANDEKWDIPALRMRHADRPLLPEADVRRLPHWHRSTPEDGPIAERQILANQVAKPSACVKDSGAEFRVAASGRKGKWRP